MARCSCTKAIPARATAWVFKPARSCLSNTTLPPRGGVMRMMERRVVVLPAPLRPSSATTSPACASSETP